MQATFLNESFFIFFLNLQEFNILFYQICRERDR